MTLRLILTHENADFDAVASMLAMYKLDPSAVPILPRKINRNVRNFLTLYRSSLPMREADDIQRQAIELVYAVDTQTFNNVRGMQTTTPIHYIDHHEQARPAYEHEIFELATLGANTTQLVERLQKQHLSITTLEATLLLLGIYEDTGSLSFGLTTLRDMKAATWLVEHGADLDQVREFLTYPLQDAQRPIYEELNATAEILEIAGHTILIATAHTDADVPELSALSHKLGDLYDPNATVLAIQMGEHVQLIGRSGVDEINIGTLLKDFGGGGHARAAAALLRDQRLEDVMPKLQQELTAIVQPSIRVRDMMSSGNVFTFEADTTIGEAIEQTKHTSHEGYPILRDGKVIGLLTRHAMDRARNHGMHKQKVTDVMEAGGVTIHPHDSLEALRQQMMDTGWGQMPVVNEEDQLVGIVTRTDLIRLWNETTMQPRKGELLLGKLQESLPATLWILVEAIAKEAQQLKVGLYLIGGIVRDLLLGVPNLDIDFVIEGNAIDFVTHLHRKFGGDMRQHLQFTTAKWLLDDALAQALGFENRPPEWPDTMDFATARTEFYDEPTILPTVRQSSIKLDLHRRDFTINALAIRLSPTPAGELLDYYNGERDLHDGIIRVLHSLSFVDDPTRMIRAVRFEQRFGFHIDPRTAELFTAALPLLQRLSGDRLRNELNLIMAERHPLRYFQRLDALGILNSIHPDLKANGWFEGACGALFYFRQKPAWDLPHDFDDWRVAMFGLLTARLSEEALETLGATLTVSRTNMRHLQAVRVAYRGMLTFDEATQPSTVASVLDGLEQVGWVMLWSAAATRLQRTLIERYVEEWRWVSPIIDGRQLIEMGVEIGPSIGIILRELRRGWLDGAIQDAQAELATIAKLVDELENQA